MFQKNPLQKYEKKWFRLETDSYVDLAVRSFIELDKLLVEPTRNLKEYSMLKVMNADMLENIMLGLGMIESGVDEETGKEAAYSIGLKKAKEIVSLEEKDGKFQEDPALSAEQQKAVRMANLKFQLLLNAIKRDKPSTVELSG